MNNELYVCWSSFIRNRDNFQFLLVSQAANKNRCTVKNIYKHILRDLS